MLIYVLTGSETLVLVEDFMTLMCMCYDVLYVDVWLYVLIYALLAVKHLC